MTKPISPKGLDHLVLRTERLQEMIRFYENVLGCKVERTIDRLGLHQLRAGASLIDLVDTDGELGRKGGPAPGDDGLNLDHFCLRVEPWDEPPSASIWKSTASQRRRRRPATARTAPDPRSTFRTPTAIRSN